MRKAIVFLFLLFILLIFVQITDAAETLSSGMAKVDITRSLFNRIKLGMSMQQVEHILGAPGQPLGRENGVDGYHWDGPHSGININFQNKKVVDATAVSPDGRYFGLDGHKLGMPKIVFCTSFYNKVSHKIPMRYKDFIKLTDGEGMPISETKRHWDGSKDSYLSVDIINDMGQIWVKSGLITCPNGNMLEF